MLKATIPQIADRSSQLVGAGAILNYGSWNLGSKQRWTLGVGIGEGGSHRPADPFGEDTNAASGRSVSFRWLPDHIPDDRTLWPSPPGTCGNYFDKRDLAVSNGQSVKRE
jgi:hypothetical protein